MKRLYLSATNKKIGGVCGGLGEYFGVDPTLVRIIFILIGICSVGLGVLAYILMWMVMPSKSQSEGGGSA